MGLGEVGDGKIRKAMNKFLQHVIILRPLQFSRGRSVQYTVLGVETPFGGMGARMRWGRQWHVWTDHW